MPIHRSAHDYAHLLRRWRAIARASGLTSETIHTAAGLPVLMLRSRKPVANALRVYFSAGVHGDEAAGTEGLVSWASEFRKTSPASMRRFSRV